MKLLVTLLMLLPGMAMAGYTSKDVFQKIDCNLLKDGVVLKEHSEYMMNVSTEQAAAKFSQIQFGDAELKIQYQLFIEDDLSGAAPGMLIYLQNLMVGDLESSVEVSSQQARWVSSTLKEYSVQCELAEPIQ